MDHVKFLGGSRPISPAGDRDLIRGVGRAPRNRQRFHHWPDYPARRGNRLTPP